MPKSFDAHRTKAKTLPEAKLTRTPAPVKDLIVDGMTKRIQCSIRFSIRSVRLGSGAA